MKPTGSHGLLALDWQSGNRSVLVDHELSGLIIGLTLQTPPEDVYRALLESTAFGTHKIIETFNESGVPVREFIAAGGLIKNRVLMQLYSDVLHMPISIIDSEQGPALGSAIHAAVAAEAYQDVQQASDHMGQLREHVYVPDPAASAIYDRLYADYVTLHDYFGRGGNDVMHRLKALRRETLADEVARDAAPGDQSRISDDAPVATTGVMEGTLS
ncbi:FGGY-family carbohydrate kinase [Propionibacterium freudenreichii]|uniref:FGGY-family carbohydrate kinase n=1 Tax=Propionibacterium freudenreichii TaxID=1744 RepID=UPI000BC2D571|nr:FGGY-family carbohydrate kinase [Propionibacterium freudenreichii]SBM43730.1 Ribulokinase domain protein [Propionibacterium freudenreichii]